MPSGYEAYFDYTSNEKVIFHTTLNASDDMNLDIYQFIDVQYDVTSDADPEVKQRWLPMGIYLGADSALPASKTWVSSMGRNKYVEPNYKALQAMGEHDTGVEWLCDNENFYHPVTISAVLGDLELEEMPDCSTILTGAPSLKASRGSPKPKKFHRPARRLRGISRP